MKYDEYWRDKLTAEEYEVCREKGTERPFSGEYWDTKDAGVYNCRCCGEPLFLSDSKFDAGCGWPSFYKQLDDGNVDYREDLTHGMRRVEIFCKQCNSHLGHVFPDGPAPTGQLIASALQAGQEFAGAGDCYGGAARLARRTTLVEAAPSLPDESRPAAPHALANP